MANCISFWEYLDSNEIRIPMLQRDYAQGRRGKEQLRKRFLQRIKEALDDTTGNRNLVLDFVYGKTECSSLKTAEKCFLPIDGQQRLTTVWLLYWYIAFRSNIKSSECSRLENFSYMTRLASEKFFHKIISLLDRDDCDHMHVDLIKYIREQTWYSPDWDADPTIDSAMRMLGGDEDILCDGLETLDGMVRVFDSEGFHNRKYWDRLVRGDSPAVSFYVVELNEQELSDPDDLYIKLNDRGLSLVGFENFKADLVGHIRLGEQNINGANGEYVGCCWRIGKNNIKMSLAVAAMADNCWTDVFWRLCRKSYDRYMFAFINRFLMCRRAADMSIPLPKHVISDASFKEYAKYRDDPANNVKYEGFDPYKTIKKVDVEQLLKVFLFCHKMAHLGKLSELDSLMEPPWDKKGAALFLPREIESCVRGEAEGLSAELTYKDAAVFAAILKLIEKTNLETPKDPMWESASMWIRVARNISENCIDNNAEEFVGVVRMLCKMIDSGSKSYAGDVIKYLIFGVESDGIDEVCGQGEGAAKRKAQLKEEVIKAKLWGRCSGSILNAESRPYFKGRINYLLNAAIAEMGGAAEEKDVVEDLLEKTDLDFLNPTGLQRWMDRVVSQWQGNYGGNAVGFDLSCSGLFKGVGENGKNLLTVAPDKLKKQIYKPSMLTYSLMASFQDREEVAGGRSSILDRIRMLNAEWQLRYDHMKYYNRSTGIHLCLYGPSSPWEFRESIRVDDAVRWWYDLPEMCSSDWHKQPGGNWIRVKANYSGVERFYSFDQECDKRKIQIEKKNFSGEWGPECVWDKGELGEVLESLHRETKVES